MIATAHQPHYIPWIGYIHRISLADKFTIMDNMEFTKYTYINRNRIRDKDGTVMLTLPIKYKGASKKLIKDIELDYGSGFKGLNKHLKSITHNYKSAKGFDDFFPRIEAIYQKNHKWLFDLDYELLKAILKYLHIKTQIVIASEKNIKGDKEDKLFLSILENTNCNTILLGLGASTKYINPMNISNKNNFKIVCQKFVHPVYPQKIYSDFYEGISIIDMLLNVSRNEAINLINNAGNYETK